MALVWISLIVLGLSALCSIVVFLLRQELAMLLRRWIERGDGTYGVSKEDGRSSKYIKLEAQIQAREAELEEKSLEVGRREAMLQEREKAVVELEEQKNRLIAQYHKELDEVRGVLSHYLGMSIEEAKKQLLKILEQEMIDERGKIIRRYENEAKEEARKRANYIIAQATTRYAGEFATERLINVIQLPDDELKGRIIGKEGRNIKAIEKITGVDVIIDDTPSVIVLSSFNLYRRAIATKMVEALIEDGRIQPSRIEEVYTRVCEEMEEQILHDGEEAVLNLGLGYMHPELKKLLGKMKYRASFGQNALGHSIEVANLAGVIAGELGGDVKLAKRAGILHDIGKSLTQEVGGNHIDLGYEVCVQYQEDPVVLNAIKAHHGCEEARSIEAAAVCAADVLSAARPGARREALENFLQRSSEMEALALAKPGVKQAYVISAGREVRVIVDAELRNDEQSSVLAREIAKEIEEGFAYPGEIKINVIRESRCVEYAH
ncbi:ribonuclease Y [Helicobacter enhydrae]|uniref:Ribonuclease Y n=1 Tax=Helicobacter enhydrae TaxID=222136 RepID=A0A1B1U731_9HELI|nr:ribonuclease Y [Helicobacter enhydrae]ANV98594.1 ribonuclease Y [Helicobacter enhydrae]